MTLKTTTSALFGTLAASIVFFLSADAFAVDADAAITLAKQNGCLKCHNFTREQQEKKQKDGKPWFEVATKYKGKADAEAKLINHITSGEKAKFPDGHEEEHKIIKTTDVAQQKNLVNWILSL